MIKTILTFLIIFSVIVIFHEYGHFYFARKAGIQVREFSLGMGPKLFSRQAQDGITYTVRVLPIGGYVRLAGLAEEEPIEPGMEVALSFDEQGIVNRINLSSQFNTDELPVRVNQCDLVHALEIEAMPVGANTFETYAVSRTAHLIETDGTELQIAPFENRYEAASPWAKLMTNIAGPINNFILSIVVYTIVAMLLPGVPQNSPKAILGEIQTDSPAAVAQLKNGDVVTRINDQTIDTWQQMVETIRELPNHDAMITYERDGSSHETTVHVKEATDQNTKKPIGVIGVTKGDLYDQSMGARLTYGFKATWAVVTGVLGALASMVSRGLSVNEIGGPIAMAQMTNQVVRHGLVPVLSFLAYISANLGVVNLLPIPALDGGKIILNVIEGVRGKPVSQQVEGIITIIGVIFLMALMLFVTWNDIQRAFF